MSDGVRITLAEASDVHRLILDYIDENRMWEDEIEIELEMNEARLSDFVNRIGEVYEYALARAIKDSVRETTSGHGHGRR